MKLLKDNKVDERARVLLVVSEKDDNVRRATNNLGQVKVVQAMYLNVFDILNADRLLISKKALDIVTKWLTKEEK